MHDVDWYPAPEVNKFIDKKQTLEEVYDLLTIDGIRPTIGNKKDRDEAIRQTAVKMFDMLLEATKRNTAK
jgi:hypothetical protein